MKVIGLTGGVGAGKTTVLRMMEEHFPVRCVVADEVGHLAYTPGSETYQKILEHFGKRILCGGPENTSGCIDRKALAEIVMKEKQELTFLNSVIHPFVKSYVMERREEAEAAGCPYFIIESAILMECGYESICDEFWYVYASEDVRRKRLKDDRGYAEEKIENLYKNQQKEEYFREKCTKIIENNCGKETILAQLKVLLV